jgi:serine/threonine protein kinase
MHAFGDEALHESDVVPSHIWSGRTLNNIYMIGSLIEQGAIAEVYDGTEISTGEHVAIKILLPQLAEDAKSRSLFLDEARRLTRLSQPGLPLYRTCAQDPNSGLTYIVTELMGPTLSAHLPSLEPTYQEILSFTKRLSLALAAAHQSGLVHRHLSPDNIRIPGGRLAHATITNFGLAKFVQSGGKFASLRATIDSDYCAPEQLSAQGDDPAIGPWTDVYSLALVVVTIAGGKPEEGAKRSRGGPDLSALPQRLRPILARMLAPELKKRFRSMDEVIAALNGLPQDSPAPGNFAKRSAKVANILWLSRRTGSASPAPGPRPVATTTEIASRFAPVSSAPPSGGSALAKAADMAASFRAVGRAGTALVQGIASRAPKLPAVEIPWFSRSAEKAIPAPEPRPSAVLVAARSVQPVRWSSRAPIANLAAVRTGNQSRSIRAVGGASIALVAVCLVAGFWAVQKLLPPPPVASAAKQEGTVYGAENTGSRFTLRIHRPTIVLISGRTGQFLVERAMQAGDSYRAPNLPDLTVTTQDAGAVEVVFDEKSLGYIGKNGTSAQRVSLRRFVPALQVKTAKETAGRTTKPSTTKETARAVPPKPETTKQAESVNNSGQATAAANVADRTAVSSAAPSQTPAVRETADQAIATKQAAAPRTGLPQGTNQPAAMPSIFEQVIEAETKAADSSTPQSMRAKPVILKQDPAQAARDVAARAKALKELDERKAIERERQRRAFSNSLKGLSTAF